MHLITTAIHIEPILRCILQKTAGGGRLAVPLPSPVSAANSGASHSSKHIGILCQPSNRGVLLTLWHKSPIRY